MLGNSYASKKRKKPVLKQKKLSDNNEVVKSNPSKRHRDRLNGELDQLTDLLPFTEDVRSRLDKLSVLRLSVGYLRTKSYFKASMKSGSRSSSLMFPGLSGPNGDGGTVTTTMDTGGFTEGDLLLQALNGFVMVVTSDSSVFYSSPTIKEYLGFHQSDVVHQNVLELIHTDDRELFRQQLHFALDPSNTAPAGDVSQPCGSAVLYSPEQLPPENSSFLERSFVCRFRCLLDNSSGFLALKFQGRLKYLHGQGPLQANGTRLKPQLALFTIAMPVQPVSIVEIRAKMLLFQSKHKLDFTPMGMDTRGRVILGYSEVELCMKGTGYQFIHAADMMYCADNHIRMIKTGESGLTVFRLLSKSGGWVWVKANAKLIFKGGRPDFIIAYQKALVNAEGEEYLRQRRLQLPFSVTTGEAILYNTGPTVDLPQFQFDKMFGSNDANKDVTPGSLLDCFLRQDETIYTQTVDPPTPVDQVFMDSRALLSVSSDAWQEGGPTAATGEPVAVKEEAKQSVMAVIGNLEKIADGGDFCAALQDLEVDERELRQWESALKRLNHDDAHNNLASELDSILTNDIFDYIDGVLFKEKAELGAPSCLSAVGRDQSDLTPERLPSLCDPQLFQTPSPDHTLSFINGTYSHLQGAMNGAVIAGQSSAQMLNNTQSLPHQGPPVPRAEPILPPLQQLQLQDIFSPSIELPELTLPDASVLFPSCRQVSNPHTVSQGGPGQSGRPPGCPPSVGHAPAANGHFRQSPRPPDHVAPFLVDYLPPLIPCNDFSPSGAPNIPVPFAPSCLQGGPSLGPPSHQVQQWPQSQQQKLSHAGVVQNGHDVMSGSQSFPRSGPWPSNVSGPGPHPQQGGQACGQAANPSSCMFNQHFSSGAPGSDVLALSGSAGLRGADVSLDQSPPQGSCYFQWSQTEPVVGTSAINQPNGQHTLNRQHYQHTYGPGNMSHCGRGRFTQ